MDAIYPAGMRRYCSASQDEVAAKPLHGGRKKSPRKLWEYRYFWLDTG